MDNVCINCAYLGRTSQWGVKGLSIMTNCGIMTPLSEYCYGNQENLSTENEATEARARFSRPHEEERRPSGAQAQAGERQETTDRVNRKTRRAKLAGFCWTMLKNENRLRAEKDFASLFKKGRSVSEGTLTLKFAPNRKSATRVGFVVGTKVSKRATVRNLLKRRLREILRKAMPSIVPGFDVAFITRVGAANLDFQALQRIVSVLLHRARLFKPTPIQAKR